MSLQFGFSTNAFREYELTEAIEIIGAAGYDGVELLFDEPHLYPPTATSEEIETVQQSIRAADLTISNCNAFMLTAIENFHHPSFIEPEIADRTKRLEYTHASIKTAKHSASLTSLSNQAGQSPKTNPARGGSTGLRKGCENCSRSPRTQT